MQRKQFYFVCTNNVITDGMWRDGIHANNEKIRFFTVNINDDLNHLTWSKNIWHNSRNNSKSTRSFSFVLKIRKWKLKNSNPKNKDPFFLSETRIKNVNRLIIGNLNINSISKKFGQLKATVEVKTSKKQRNICSKFYKKKGKNY